MAEHPETAPLLGPRELIRSFDAACDRGVLRHLAVHFPFGVGYSEIRAGFVERVGSRPAACWQDVWDAWVEEGRGTVQVWVARCETCRGRRLDVRRGRVCATCMGRGSHRHPVRVQVRHAPRPGTAPGT